MIFKVGSLLNVVWSPPSQHAYSIVIVVILSNVIPVTIDVSVSVSVIHSIVNPWVFIKKVFVYPFLTDRFT